MKYKTLPPKGLSWANLKFPLLEQSQKLFGPHCSSCKGRQGWKEKCGWGAIWGVWADLTGWGMTGWLAPADYSGKLHPYTAAAPPTTHQLTPDSALINGMGDFQSGCRWPSGVRLLLIKRLLARGGGCGADQPSPDLSKITAKCILLPHHSLLPHLWAALDKCSWAKYARPTQIHLRSPRAPANSLPPPNAHPHPHFPPTAPPSQAPLFCGRLAWGERASWSLLYDRMLVSRFILPTHISRCERQSKRKKLLANPSQRGRVILVSSLSLLISSGAVCNVWRPDKAVRVWCHMSQNGNLLIKYTPTHPLAHHSMVCWGKTVPGIHTCWSETYSIHKYALFMNRYIFLTLHWDFNDMWVTRLVYIYKHVLYMWSWSWLGKVWKYLEWFIVLKF